MARQTATVEVGVKVSIAQVAIPGWLRAVLIEQGWTPPAGSDDRHAVGRNYATGGFIPQGDGSYLVGEAGPELELPEDAG